MKKILLPLLLALAAPAVAKASPPSAKAQVTLTLIQPGYRSMIFASEKFHEIKGELKPADPAARFSDLEVHLAPLDAKAGPALTGTGDPATGKAEVDGIDALPDGNYRLEVKGHLGTEAFTVDRTIRKLPPEDGEVWVDAAGVVQRNGRPFPGFGFCFGVGLLTPAQLLPGTHMNVLLPLLAKPPYTEARDKIRKLYAQGYLIVVYVRAALPPDAEQKQKEPLTEQEKAGLHALTSVMRGEPGVLGYYQPDEPEGNGYGPARIKDIYELLKADDPHKAVFMVNHRRTGITDMVDCADVFLPDPYPMYMVGKGPKWPQGLVDDVLPRVPLGQESYRARWFTPQAFNFTGRGPTAEEMRAQTVLALIYGATGITYYPSYMVWDEPGVASSLPYLSEEFEALQTFFIETRPRLLKQTGNPGIHAALSTLGNRKVLWIGNGVYAPAQGKIEDPDLAGVSEWQVVGTKEKIPGGGAVTVTLEPDQALVLASPEVTLPATLDWTAVRQKEADLWKAALIPGDVALKSAGAKASTFPVKDTGFPQTWLAIDGMNDPRARGWFSHEQVPPGGGFEIALPHTCKLREIRLTHAEMPGATVEVSTKDGAKEVVGTIPEDPAAEGKVDFKLDGRPVDFIRIRLPVAHHAELGEVEAYE